MKIVSISTLTIASASLLPVFVDSVLRGSLLLAAVLLLMTAMHRSSAATRHAIWIATMAALLILPIFSLTLPKWRILPEWRPSSIDEPIPVSTRPKNSIVTIDALPSTVVAVNHAEPAFNVSPQVAAAQKFNGSLFIFGLWGAGFLILMSRLLLGHYRLWLRARLGSAAPKSISATANRIARDLGLKTPLRFVLSDGMDMPMTWGLLKPTIQLPSEATNWKSAELRSVLLHELAYTKRRDTTAQLLVQLACAFHWFNPLVWLAAHRIEIERERACDDLVLADGVCPADYADNLLEISIRTSSRKPALGMGLPMARQSTLEKRVRAILAERLNRRHLSSTASATVIFLFVTLVMPFALLDIADGDEAEQDPLAEKKMAAEMSGFTAPTDDSSMLSAEGSRPPVHAHLPHKRSYRLAHEPLIEHDQPGEQERIILDRYEALKTQLQVARQTYLDSHPKIHLLESEIKNCEIDMKRARLEDLASKAGVPFELMEVLQSPNKAAGIGVVIRNGARGYPQITTIIEGSPAEKTGLLKVSDEIRRMRNHGSTKWIDLQHLRIGPVVQALRGESGSIIEISITRQDDVEMNLHDISIKRELLKLEAEDKPQELSPLETFPSKRVEKSFSFANPAKQVEVKENEINHVLLKFAEATELGSTLEALKIEGAEIYSNERTNSLILRGDKASIETLKKLVAELDVPTVASSLVVKMMENGYEVTSHLGTRVVGEAEVETYLKSLFPHRQSSDVHIKRNLLSSSHRINELIERIHSVIDIKSLSVTD